MANAVEAKHSVAIAETKDYSRQVIKKGMKFLATDKRVKNNPDHFADVEEIIEAATAAPGEKREVKPRNRTTPTNTKNKKKAATKPAAKAAQVKVHDKAVAKLSKSDRKEGTKAVVGDD